VAESNVIERYLPSFRNADPIRSHHFMGTEHAHCGDQASIRILLRSAELFCTHAKTTSWEFWWDGVNAFFAWAIASEPQNGVAMAQVARP
jgi:hypothetical protein